MRQCSHGHRWSVDPVDDNCSHQQQKQTGQSQFQHWQHQPSSGYSQPYQPPQRSCQCHACSQQPQPFHVPADTFTASAGMLCLEVRLGWPLDLFYCLIFCAIQKMWHPVWCALQLLYLWICYLVIYPELALLSSYEQNFWLQMDEVLIYLIGVDSDWCVHHVDSLTVSQCHVISRFVCLKYL